MFPAIELRPGPASIRSLGRLVALELLNLTPLALDLTLLTRNLALLRARGYFLVLQRVADDVAGARAKRTADRRARRYRERRVPTR